MAIWGGGCKIELLGSWDKEEGGLSELGIASQGILLETVLCCNATVAYCSRTLLSRLGVLSAVCKRRPPSHAPRSKLSRQHMAGWAPNISSNISPILGNTVQL